jgi:hypothetical protein
MVVKQRKQKTLAMNMRGYGSNEFSYLTVPILTTIEEMV